jgi:hypothetical protein
MRIGTAALDVDGRLIFVQVLEKLCRFYTVPAGWCTDFEQPYEKNTAFLRTALLSDRFSKSCIIFIQVRQDGA